MRGRAGCLQQEERQKAWEICDHAYANYNWIHAAPNAAAQIIALWFGEDDLDTTLAIIRGSGHDADCNAAQILRLRHGTRIIAPHWSAPLQAGGIITYMRRPRSLSFEHLVEMTMQATQR